MYIIIDWDQRITRKAAYLTPLILQGAHQQDLTILNQGEILLTEDLSNQAWSPLETYVPTNFLLDETDE